MTEAVAPDFAQPRRGRALFVTYLVPVSEEGAAAGTYRRQRMLIEAIKAVCCEIEVLSYVLPRKAATEPLSAQATADVLANLWNGNFSVVVCDRDVTPRRQSFWHKYVRPASGFLRLPGYETFAGDHQRDALEDCLRRRPDFIFVQRLMCMPPLLRTTAALPPVFLDLDDIEHVAFARSIAQPPTWPGKRLFHLQIPALIAGERKSIELAHKVFVCSALDRNLLRHKFAVDNIETIENALPIPHPAPPQSQANLLLIGSYGYAPNRAAAEFFLDDIWPRILAAVPDARLTIAGPRPELIHHHKRPPDGVAFTGFVADLDGLYAKARVVVCPILSGGGTRVKIVEAMAYGRPTVSTHLGAEGLELRDGIEIMLRDAPTDFAAACIDLLRDDERAAAIGAHARQAALRCFDFSQVSAKLAAFLRNAVPPTVQAIAIEPDQKGAREC